MNIPKSAEELLEISGSHSYLMPNSFSMWGLHSRLLISINMVREALLESVMKLLSPVSLAISHVSIVPKIRSLESLAICFYTP